MFPQNNHNQFMPQAPPPPHFPVSALADAGSNGGGGGVENALMAMGGGIAHVGGMGQIDWAQLAQQWIHMRDQTSVPTHSTPGPPAPPNFGMLPMAPPPPIISNAPEYQRQQMPSLPHYEEHGEADMDMDDDTERGVHGLQDMQMSSPPPSVANQIGQSATNAAASCRGGQQQQPWTNWSGQGNNRQGISNPTAHIPSLLKLNVSNPNEPHCLTHQQQQQGPSSQHQQQLPLHSQQQQQQSEVSNTGSASEIDTNKRKMLPAWIREGLEKMEREKQRQLEREQPITPTNLGLLDSSTDHDHQHHQQQPQQQGQNVKQVSSKTLTTPVNLMNFINVDSNSEDSQETELSEATSVSTAQLKGKDMLIRTTRRSHSGFDHDHYYPQGNNETELQQRPQRIEDGNDAAGTRVKQGHDIGKNYEERLADLMLVVRRTLTEILLETTNEEIAIIANETMKAHRAKASSAQVIRKSALSSITGNLGLAAYGDSSSESEGDDNDDVAAANKDIDDERIGNTTDSSKEPSKQLQQLSAEELKARIRRSKRSFEKVINDIEHRVAQQEQRDELVLEKQRKLEMERLAERQEFNNQRESHTEPTGETLLLGPSSDKVKMFNGKRPSRKERTTRFSDNKDSKQSNQSYVQHVVVASVAPSSVGMTTSSSTTAVPPKLKPVPNVATNLLQMPESVANMLSAADKALQKVNKSSSRRKPKRRHSSTTSTSSSSSGSSGSSSTSSSSSSSDSSTSGTTTKSSSSRSFNSKKKRSSHRASSSNSRRRHNRDRERDHDQRGSCSRSRSRNKYERQEQGKERERRHHYDSSTRSMHRRRPNQRDSSHSGDEQLDNNRHRSSRHDYGKKRQHTRSRSRSRSRNHHHSHSISQSSSSSASHHRKRV